MTAPTPERLFDLSRDDDQRMNQETMQRFAANDIRSIAKDADEAGAGQVGPQVAVEPLVVRLDQQ